MSKEKMLKKAQVQWEKNWTEKGVEKEANNVREDSCDPHIKTHFPFVTDVLKSLPKNGFVLEAGCGLGHWVFYAEKIGCQCIGLDFTVNTLRLVQGYADRRKSKATFVVADIQNLPFESRSIDGILSFGVIEHFLDPAAILKDMYRVMKPCGKALVTTPNVYCSHTFTRPVSKLLGKWHLGYETSYSPKELGNLVTEAGFNICRGGVMVGGEIFGTAAKYLPVMGPPLYNCLASLSKRIEEKTNLFGFWSYVIAEKPA